MPYSDLRVKQNSLIRKALDGSLFYAKTSAPAVTTLTSTGGDLATLPAGYADGGHFTSDGISFGREVNESEVTSMGSTTPTRVDVLSDIGTVSVTFQETSKATLEMYTGADLSATAPDANGEISIEKPLRPTTQFYRLLALAVDENDAGEIYIARFLPRVKVTDFGEQTYNSDGEIQYSLTFRTFEDEDLGYTERYIFGGPGWTSILTDMGFPDVTP